MIEANTTNSRLAHDISVRELQPLGEGPFFISVDIPLHVTKEKLAILFAHAMEVNFQFINKAEADETEELVKEVLGTNFEVLMNDDTIRVTPKTNVGKVEAEEAEELGELENESTDDEEQEKTRTRKQKSSRSASKSRNNND